MTYEEAVEFLYSQTPQFQQIGAAAYKPGLDTVRRLATMWGSPEKRIKTIHVGGTNGKGSTSHTLAAILQSGGLKVGLFTSPHLVDFRERIRVDGEMISPEEVAAFVERFSHDAPADLRPSFFELTTIMAFDHFARHGVDVAVIEVGLGGRLDSTNIITPELSIITNISFDHMAQLGNTLESIAAEKSGIMKPQVDAVVGEAEGAVRRVFEEKAREVGVRSLTFAQDETPYGGCSIKDDHILYSGSPFGDIEGQLTGDCQVRNTATILTALKVLCRRGWNISPEAVRRGFANVCGLTGLMGRWMKIGEKPLRICDTGHNEGGWQYLGKRLANIAPDSLHMVIGFVNDKDVSHILPLMPTGARYYFAKASVPRALDSQTLKELAATYGLCGEAYRSVEEAYAAAQDHAAADHTIFVGGSTFVVADLMRLTS